MGYGLLHSVFIASNGSMSPSRMASIEWSESHQTYASGVHPIAVGRYHRACWPRRNWT